MRLLKIYFLLNCYLSSQGQVLILKEDKIYDSRVDSYVKKNRSIDPGFFDNNKDFWIQTMSYSVLGLNDFGIKYLYDFETKSLRRIDGLFEVPKKILLKHDFTGAIGFNFYFEKSVIAWLTKSSVPSTLALRYVDVDRNTRQEIVFSIPRELQDIEPIIIDTVRLLFNRYILNRTGKLDTLELDRGATLPAPGDKVFMRNQAYMIDKYFEQKNPRAELTKTNPIDFNRIIDNRLVTQKVILTGVKAVNYRVEANYGDIWLLSHKSNPEDFCLYNVNDGKSYPFKLDKAVFNFGNLSLAEIVAAGETSPGRDVTFSYMVSMTYESIYIYLVKNGITLYKVPNYRKLLR